MSAGGEMNRKMPPGCCVLCTPKRPYKLSKPQVVSRKGLSASGPIILGIDPGTQVMGYGLVRSLGMGFEHLEHGVLRLDKYSDPLLRLQRIHDACLRLLEEWKPREVSVEAPFHGKNVQSMLKLGRAQGVVMATALRYRLPIFEYAPRKVKMAVTGNGNASKEQMAAMVMRLLDLRERPEMLDASDGLGVALCHALQGKAHDVPDKASSWEAFIRDNPSRVKK